MPAERYFIDSSLDEEATVVLQDQEFHHLAHVMRGKEGDEIELVNGRGQLAYARITQLNKKQCVAAIKQVIQEKKSPIEIILAQGIPRINRLDFILEKGVELGMTQFWLLPAQNSDRKSLTDQQIDKMKLQMIAAMKQCGRLYLPQIKLMTSLKTLFDLQNYQAYFGDLDPKAPSFIEELRLQKIGKGVIFFTGPESGFTSEEIAQLKILKAKGVRLHPNILRTDTASLTALSLLTHWIHYSS